MEACASESFAEPTKLLLSCRRRIYYTALLLCRELSEFPAAFHDVWSTPASTDSFGLVFRCDSRVCLVNGRTVYCRYKSVFIFMTIGFTVILACY